MQPAVDVAHKRQQNAARLVAEHQQQLGIRVQRLGELQAYRDEYASQFSAATQPMLGMKVREYRLFLDRLNQAIEEQQGHVEQARELLRKTQEHWTHCRIRSDAIAKAIDRLVVEQRQQQTHREQVQTDEFGQRPHPARLPFNN